MAEKRNLPDGLVIGKNTFIEVEEPADGDQKRRRTSSAPPSSTAAETGSGEGGEKASEKVAAPTPSPAKQVSIAVDSNSDVGTEATSSSKLGGAHRGSKRSRSREQQHASASRSRPRNDASKGSQCSGTKGPKELDDEERHAKRVKHVADMKETGGYQNYLKDLQAGKSVALEVPEAPDPHDRNISKREWERQIFAWREALKPWGDVSAAQK